MAFFLRRENVCLQPSFPEYLTQKLTCSGRSVWLVRVLHAAGRPALVTSHDVETNTRNTLFRIVYYWGRL
ncbi:hypothetical protein E2C01_070538 [Portunus trituberculatus]|uniref:Uncharacterized protein n=1 Tax=Portunus trituberculatus TaxID=210409 RepID=A0A5B7I1K1_PORTR|nr:hypothetical protein [Portunus trituberculatus]